MAYEYREFPKWVKTYDGKDVVVNDAEEEAKVTKKEIKKPNKKEEW